MLFDRNISSLSVQKRARLGLGRTYQISQLFLELTVEQNLFLASYRKGGVGASFFTSWVSFKDARKWIKEVADQVGLEEYIHHTVSELSHGMQRQLEIGIALAMKPKLIMLDEPAAGLSPSERQELKQLLLKLPKDITMVLIEHDMELVLEIAERIDVLHRGSLIASDTPENIQTNKEVQEVYLGSAYVE